MAWTIEIAPAARKDLKQIDHTWQRRITNELKEIATLINPRSRGKGLVGEHAGLWRYRVGDYRIICQIRDDVLVITAIRIGHRSKVYIQF